MIPRLICDENRLGFLGCGSPFLAWLEASSVQAPLLLSPPAPTPCLSTSKRSRPGPQHLSALSRWLDLAHIRSLALSAQRGGAHQDCLGFTSGLGTQNQCFLLFLSSAHSSSSAQMIELLHIFSKCTVKEFLVLMTLNAYWMGPKPRRVLRAP